MFKGYINENTILTIRRAFWFNFANYYQVTKNIIIIFQAFTRGTPPGKVCIVHPESSEQNFATSSDSNETDSEASKQIVLATASNSSCSDTNLDNLVDPSPPSSMPHTSTFARTAELSVSLENNEACCDSNSSSNNTTFNSKPVILSDNNSENFKQNIIEESDANSNEISVECGVEEKFDHTDQNDEDSANGFSTLKREISVELGEVADTDHDEPSNAKSEGTVGVTPGMSGEQPQHNQNNLDLLVEPDLADIESDNKKVEMGVAADMFWDSVSSRAQVLAVPNSFKTGSKKTFRQF